MIVLDHGATPERVVVGIDPGKRGAIAWVDADTRSLLAVADVPLTGLSIETSTTEVVDGDALAELRDWGPNPIAIIIERAQAIPQKSSRQGVSSSANFNFGANWGALRAGFCRGAPVHDVMSAKWKRDVGLSNDKALSLGRARQIWPKQAAMCMHRAMDDGRAEAALLADYGIDHVIGGLLIV